MNAEPKIWEKCWTMLGRCVAKGAVERTGEFLAINAMTHGIRKGISDDCEAYFPAQTGAQALHGGGHLVPDAETDVVMCLARKLP